MDGTRWDDEDMSAVHRMRAGDMDAAADLVARHRPGAVRLARRLVPACDAEDVVGEALTSVLTAIRGGGGPTRSFRAYLHQAVRGSAAAHHRRVSRCTPSDHLADTAGDATVTPATPTETEDAVVSAYRGLAPRHREILRLVLVEELSTAQVARRLGIERRTVSSAYGRARQTLRRRFIEAVSAAVDHDCAQTLRTLTSSRAADSTILRTRLHLDRCEECRARREQIVAMFGRSLKVTVGTAAAALGGGVAIAISEGMATGAKAEAAVATGAASKATAGWTIASLPIKVPALVASVAVGLTGVGIGIHSHRSDGSGTQAALSGATATHSPARSPATRPSSPRPTPAPSNTRPASSAGRDRAPTRPPTSRPARPSEAPRKAPSEPGARSPRVTPAPPAAASAAPATRTPRIRPSTRASAAPPRSSPSTSRTASTAPSTTTRVPPPTGTPSPSAALSGLRVESRTAAGRITRIRVRVEVIPSGSTIRLRPLEGVAVVAVHGMPGSTFRCRSGNGEAVCTARKDAPNGASLVFKVVQDRPLRASLVVSEPSGKTLTRRI